MKHFKVFIEMVEKFRRNLAKTPASTRNRYREKLNQLKSDDKRFPNQKQKPQQHETSRTDKSLPVHFVGFAI